MENGDDHPATCFDGFPKIHRLGHQVLVSPLLPGGYAAQDDEPLARPDSERQDLLARLALPGVFVRGVADDAPRLQNGGYKSARLRVGHDLYPFESRGWSLPGPVLLPDWDSAFLKPNVH